MRQFFADFHVHIGSTRSGKAVKITASRKLTFAAIIEECYHKKGIDIVGIVDCAALEIVGEIEFLIEQGELHPLPDGGFIHKDRVIVIPGSEIECVEDNGGVSHHIGYFPYLRQVKEFSQIMRKYIKNMELSSQSCGIPARELLEVISATGGIYIPAHAFTPHKSVYGRVTKRLHDIFSEEQFESIAALELGLSADTDIADRIEELQYKSFLSNSDAHSIEKIAREYNIFEMDGANFKEVVLALRGIQGRRIIANFGLDPRLGRYHRSYCQICKRVSSGDPPVLSCEKCFRSDEKFVLGVIDRVAAIGDYNEPRHPDYRPPYYYQIPLEFVPGLSKGILDRLIDHFGSEMAVLHTASKKDLQKVVGWKIARDILSARTGKLSLSAGGGGKYGKVHGMKPRGEQLTFNF